ncbi:cadherin-like domain-containing protein [Mycobacterium sp. ITM-2016-00317]|uniref:Ig-like domain-containing protein n=1 Tax=Mycobacterium sp. ITM-2016-00317 TaxID=2099694 RepID=UPI00287F7EB3|nr:cadherin-like domain-containing protein [Mycobacterium sp. ITM-2016-00317]WNG86686.1 cadherin-like domain-containing protein [Mycobacterium sp. ITM-2016-00317]
MGHARFVGRVGALAVALGIGAATVTLPGVAWAEPGETDTSTSAEHAQIDDNSEDSTAETGARPTDDADADVDSADDADAQDSAVEDETDDEPPAEDGKEGTYGSNRDGGEHEELGPDDTQIEDAEAEDPVEGDRDEAEDAAAEPAQEPVPPAEDVTPQHAVEISEEPDRERTSTPAPVVRTLFAPQSSDGPAPTAPVESPLLWALLAFARRQFGQPRTELGDGGTPTGTTGLADGSSSAAPQPGQVTTRDPGVFTGSVSGRVNATDPDGGWLTYSGSADTEKGKVTVTAWGTFRYTPTAAARHAAAAAGASAQDKADSFTVTVRDAAGNAVEVPVTVEILPRNADPIGARARAGNPSLTTGTAIVSVSAYDFDRDTLHITGPLSTDKGTLVDNGDGTFTYTPTAAAREAAGAVGAPAGAGIDTLTFTVDDGHGGIRTATVDVVVAAYVEASASTPGRAAGPVLVSSTGTIYQVTYDLDSTNTPIRTRVSILDEDGRVLRTTDVLAGYPVEQSLPVVRPDGSLVVTTFKASSNTSTISIVDGQGAVQRVGTVIGQPSAPMVLAPNGVVFFTTRQFPSGSGDRLVRVSAAGWPRVYRLGTAADTPSVAPDGSVYLVSRSFGVTSVLAVGPGGDSRRVSLPWGAGIVNDVVIGQDGRGYLAVERNVLGVNTTRVYTFNGTAHTVRRLPGTPDGATVITADGVYQYTYDESTGTSYISRVTADAITTFAALDGRVINPISVTPDGTVYVSVRDSATGTDSVAVIRDTGDLVIVEIPGTIVPVLPSVSPVVGGYDASPNTGDDGYVVYESGGVRHLAVVNPGGTIARTVTLPAGTTVATPVEFGPDGAAYQVIETRDAQGRVTSRAVLALANDTVTPALPGNPLRPNFPAIQFGPDGSGVLITVESGQSPFEYHFLRFDQNGDTIATGDLSGFLQAAEQDYVSWQEGVVFGPDGTPYVTLTGADQGVWALTSTGPVQVLDLDLGPGELVEPVKFGPDGRAFVTVSERVDGAFVTTVRTFTAPTAL